jgi:hypothetical protein
MGYLSITKYMDMSLYIKDKAEKKSFITEPGIKKIIINDVKSIVEINNDEKRIVVEIIFC